MKESCTKGPWEKRTVGSCSEVKLQIENQGEMEEI